MEPLRAADLSAGITVGQVAGRASGRPRRRDSADLLEAHRLHRRSQGNPCTGASQRGRTISVAPSLTTGRTQTKARGFSPRPARPGQCQPSIPAARTRSSRPGIYHLASTLLAKTWSRAGGGAVQIERPTGGRRLGDQNGHHRRREGEDPKSRHDALPRPRHQGRQYPDEPNFQKRPGERHGWHWYSAGVSGTREFPHVAADVNYWKSFIHEAPRYRPRRPRRAHAVRKRPPRTRTLRRTHSGERICDRHRRLGPSPSGMESLAGQG